jgi:hypothetical protein
MLNNKYPTTTKALELLHKPNVVSVPIRRFHWISKDTKDNLTMWFKNIPLVIFNSTTKEVTQEERVNYVQSGLTSIIENQIKEFKEYVYSL